MQPISLPVQTKTVTADMKTVQQFLIKVKSYVELRRCQSFVTWTLVQFYKILMMVYHTWSYLFYELCASFRAKNSNKQHNTAFWDMTIHPPQATLHTVKIYSVGPDRESYWPGSCEWLYISGPNEDVLTLALA